MNKLKTIIIASFIGSLSTIALADWKAGVSLSGVSMEPNGSEESVKVTNTRQSRSETLQAAFGSVFIEKNTGLFDISLGLDVVPYNTESEKVTNVRTDDGVNDAADDNGTTQVHVEIENPVTLYGSIPIGSDGVYGKIGASYANVLTKESMVNSTSYPDADLYGAHVSLGFERDTGAGFALRGEFGYSWYNNITSKSSSNRTRVHIKDLDGISARLSVVKSF